jgi:hypothetical protein
MSNRAPTIHILETHKSAILVKHMYTIMGIDDINIRRIIFHGAYVKRELVDRAYIITIYCGGKIEPSTHLSKNQSR